MSKFKENDRVVVNDPLGDRIGRVTKIFDFGDEQIYVVRLDSGEIIKSYDVDLTIVQEKAPDRDTITVNRNEFNNLISTAIKEASIELRDPDLLLVVNLTGVLVGQKLESILFGPKYD